MDSDVNDIIAKLDPERRRRIEERAAELIAEEMTLRELRKARQLTQARVAAELGISQDGVSRLEQRSDLLLSTLRKTVEAMGAASRSSPGSPIAHPSSCRASPRVPPATDGGATECANGSRSSRAISPRSRWTPSSTRPTTACWAGAGSTARFTVAQGRASRRNAARSADARPGTPSSPARLRPARPLRDPHRRPRVAWRRAGRARASGALLPPLLPDRGRAGDRVHRISRRSAPASTAIRSTGPRALPSPRPASHLEYGGALKRVVFACFGAEASAVYRAVIDDVFADE